ncbi:MAG: serine/threonine protein kinase [Rhodospirillales bacterium]|nr:serine/threonine protein kinase [Rhodospirillales bacterium]
MGSRGSPWSCSRAVSLRDTLRRRKQLPPPRAAWLTLEVLGALSVVHRAGYVHRDVKPNNIFVTTNDRVVLLDFGVAKALFDAPGKPSTSKGQLPGTASYMSPEYLNEAKALSPQFDVYAAGLVLWECITGRAAFANKNFVQTTHAIVNAGVPSLEEMGFDWLPWDFRAVVKSATAKDPRDRYPTVDAFAARLREAVPLLGSLPPAPVRASHPDLRRSVETRPDVARLSDPPAVPGPNDEAPKETNEPDSSSGSLSSKPSDEGEATEVRLPAMTGFLPVEHDRAQEVPLVLVHAPDSEHSTSLARLDEATVHRAELSAYLSTVDPFGGTAPDATAFVADAHDEGDSALVATITLTLRSADEAGAVHEPLDDGTALDVLHATAAPNNVAGADEDGMASSVDRLPAFGPVVGAFDGSTVDGSIALSDPVAEAADVPASQPVVGSSDRVAADQDDDDHREAHDRIHRRAAGRWEKWSR